MPSAAQLLIMAKNMMEMAERMSNQQAENIRTTNGQSKLVMDFISQQAANGSSSPSIQTTQVSIVKEPKPKKLYPEIAKHLSATGEDFEKTLVKYSKAKRRTKVAEEHLKMFDNGGYPPSVAPLQLGISQPLLDKEWPDALNGDVSIQLSIKKGATRRETMEVIHNSLYKELKEIDLEMLRIDESDLAQLSSKAKFTERANELSISPCLVSEFGVDTNDKYVTGGAVLDQEVHKRYVLAVENLEKILGVQAKRDKAKKEAENENIKIAISQPPELLLQPFVADVVRNVLAEEQLGHNGAASNEGAPVEEQMLDPEQTAKEDKEKAELMNKKSVELIKSIRSSRKVSSPPEVVGQNSVGKNGKGDAEIGGEAQKERQPRNKGKGKGDTKGKGKGKTKSSPKSKGKGKDNALPPSTAKPPPKGKGRGKGKKGKGGKRGEQ